MKKILLLLAILAGFVCLAAEFKVGPLTIAPCGAFTVDGQSFLLQHYSKLMQRTDQDAKNILPDAGYPKMENGAFILKGRYKTWGGFFAFEERITPLDKDGAQVVVKVKTIPGIKSHTQNLFFCAPLSAPEYAGRPISIGNAKFVLPEAFKNSMLKNNIPEGTVISWHKSSGGDLCKIISNAKSAVLDVRNFIPFFHIRFLSDGIPSDTHESCIKLEIRGMGPTQPLSLKSAVNRAFADEVQGDFVGGWTDQGPTNDLRMFPLGRQRFGGVDFNIINPKDNDNKSCIIMPHMTDSEKIQEFATPVTTSHLYLLHSLSWISKPDILVGEFTVCYTDGSSDSHEIRSGRESNDWWNPLNTANGRVVWKHCKGKVTIGITLSDIPVKRKPIAKLKFHSYPEACWMVVAISCGETPLAPALDFEPMVIESGEEYKPMTWTRDIIPGSALDFSFLMDAPAGKYGFVINKNGHFAFEKAPDKQLRLYGTNFCMLSSYPDHDVAEMVAERLAAYGLNAIRITHADAPMTEQQKPSYNLSPDRMDRLDYFVSCLKKRGIYITLDFFCSRAIKQGEIPGVKGKIDAMNGEFKALVLIDAEARKNYLKYVENLVNHVNPYTGTAYKDEAAIFSICEINEGNLDHWYKYANSHEVSRRYDAAFKEWLSKQKKTSATGEEREVELRRFLAHVHRTAYKEITASLRKMGVKCLLFDQNMRNWPRTTWMRQDYDLVDNHSYFDHPTGAMPSYIKNKSTLDSFVSPVAYATGRIYGKPFMISEFHWCYPNSFRRESGILMGACAAFQDWSALFRFCYTHPLESLTTDRDTVAFETNTDPIALLSDRIGALLFVRGDVKTAPNDIVIQIPESALDNESPYPDSWAPYAWMGRIGSAIGTSKGSFDALKPDYNALDAAVKQAGAQRSHRAQTIRSSTGEIEINAAKGIFKAVTPRSEVFIRNEPGRTAGKCVAVTTGLVPAAVCASSLDNQPIASSRHVVVFHLTNVYNNGDTFTDPYGRVFLKSGKLPHLLQRGTADIAIQMAMGDRIQLFALDFSGARIKELPVDAYPSGAIHFLADTACAANGVMAYEIVVK